MRPLVKFDAFFADARGSGTCYLCASENMVATDTLKAMERHGYLLPGIEDSSAPHPALALSGGEFIRLQGYWRLARSKGLLTGDPGANDPSWSVGMAIVSLSQSSNFYSTIDVDTMPALVTLQDMGTPNSQTVG